MGRASEKYQRPALIPGQLKQNLPPGGTWWVFFKGSPGGAAVLPRLETTRVYTLPLP